MTLEERMRNELMAARVMRPRTPSELRDYIRTYYKLMIPSVKVCPGHDAPFDYVVGSNLREEDMPLWNSGERNRYRVHNDCVVHACRSGGKTVCGGLVARLKAMFMPGCGIRILGGSSDQAKKMYEHISRFDRLSFSDLIQGDACQERTRYTNGSHVEILMASQTSIRGPHVPILMLDEVDEFRQEIYDGAIPIAQSMDGIRCKIEEFSTAHNQGGLMEKIIKEAPGNGKRIYKWCCWEVVKRCEIRCSPGKPHKQCYDMVKYDQFNKAHRFSEVCGGKAKKSRGYYELSDLWQKFRNLSWERFACEYLCEMPKLEDAAFPMLSDVHLVQDWPCLPAPAGWVGSQFQLVLGADAGPLHTWVVWAVVGRLDPQHDDFDTFQVLHQFATEKATAASDRADMIVAEHERLGFPKATGLFTGPLSVPQDSELAMELDKEHRRSRLFLPSPQSPAGRRCMRCDREGMQYGWESIGGLLVLRTVTEGDPRPALVFSSAARATYDALAAQQKGADEAHGVAATRYLVRGWSVFKNRLTASYDGGGGGMVIASS